MSPAARILLLEDDPAIADTVAFALRREGFAVEHAPLVGAARAAVAELPALAILDVGLPDGNGLDLCRQWRRDEGPGLRARGRIRLRDWPLDEVWGSEGDATDRTVDTQVKTLRAKLRAVRPELEPIATHRGLGYSLEQVPR